MSENSTFEANVDEDAVILGDMDEYFERDLTEYILGQIASCYFLSLIVIGVPCNILALLILIRRRLWLHHEAYIYFAVVLIVNVATLVVNYGDLWLLVFDQQLVRFSKSSDISCKLWAWVVHLVSYNNYLPFCMLLNVYLRQRLNVSSDRKECCVNLAAKYCTVFGTKVVISSLVTVRAVRNFWAFSIFTLVRYSDNLDCGIANNNRTQYMVLRRSYSC